MSAVEKGITFRDICNYKYQDQAAYFLNCFWGKMKGDKADKAYLFYKKFVAVDPKKADGSKLDEFNGLQFVEQLFKEGLLPSAMSREEFRAFLKKVDVEVDGVKGDGKMSLVEFFLSHFDQTVHSLLAAVPGEVNQEWYDAKKKIDEFKAAEKKTADKLADLEKVIAAGGVKAAGAKSEFDNLKNNTGSDKDKLDRIKAEGAFAKVDKVGPILSTPGSDWLNAKIASDK